MWAPEATMTGAAGVIQAAGWLAARTRPYPDMEWPDLMGRRSMPPPVVLVGSWPVAWSLRAWLGASLPLG